MIDAHAIIHPNARLAADVHVGPWTVIGENVEIGEGTWIGPHVVINGPTKIGKNNKIFQFASVGEVPQDKKYNDESTWLEIGDNNVIRECCTINRGTIQGGGVTKVGNNNLFMAYVARILIGTGSAFGFGGCLKISTALFEARHFAVLVGLTNLIGIVGALIGGHPWAYWVQEYGWRPTLKNAAIIGAILSIALNIGLKNVGHSPSQIIKKPFDIKKIIPLLTHPQIWLIAFYGCCMVAPIAAFSELWGPVFLMQKYQIDRLQAASITSSTFIGIAIGGPLIGYISAYVKRKKLFMLLGSLGSLSSILLAIYLPPIPLITLSFLYFLFGLSSSTMLLCFSLNSALVPTPNQGAVIGLTNTIVMAGSVLSQPLIGYLLQSSATGKFTTENFQNAFLLLPICQFIAVLLWYRIKEPLSRL